MRDHTTRLDDDVRLLAQRLFDMARNGDTAPLAAYLDAGAPLDVRTASGDTLVMLASYHGRFNTLRMLLHRGAPADTPNTHGQSPLGGAAFRGFLDICDKLLEHGADPTYRDPAGHTPAEYAAAFGHVTLATRLREAQLAAATDVA
jgi:uncharacterized protein